MEVWKLGIKSNCAYRLRDGASIALEEARNELLELARSARRGMVACDMFGDVCLKVD